MKVYRDSRGWEYTVRSNGLTGRAERWHVYYRRMYRSDPDKAWRNMMYRGGAWYATKEEAEKDLEDLSIKKGMDLARDDDR